MALPQFTPGKIGYDQDSNFWVNFAYDGQPGPWNTMVFDGKIFPGADGYTDPRTCLVRMKPKVDAKLDRAKLKGQQGHRLVQEGYLPEVLEIEILIWTPFQYAAWQALMPSLNPKIVRMKQKTDGKGRPVTKTVTTTSTAPIVSKGQTVISGVTTSSNKQVPVMVVDRPVHTIQFPTVTNLGMSDFYVVGLGPMEDGPVPQLRIDRMRVIEVFRDNKPVSKVIKPTDTDTNFSVIPEAKLDAGPDPGKV